MLKKTVTTGLAVAALLLVNAPAAQADAPVRTCKFYAVSTDGVNYDGVAAGSVVHAGGGDVSILCYLRVGFAAAPGSFTPVGTGLIAAATAGSITFTADSTAYVEICTRFTAPPHSTPDECFETVAQGDFVGEHVCATTEFIGERGFNILGLVEIDEEGDVFVGGTRQLDCPSGSELPLFLRFA